MNALQTLVPQDKGLPPIIWERQGNFKNVNESCEQIAGCQKQLDTFLQLIQEKDAALYQHSRRVQSFVRHFTQQLSLSTAEAGVIEVAALLHDLGKIIIDDAILQKTSSLTQKELEQIQQHPAYGAMLLRQIGAPKNVIHLVYHHHERWDGTGYPTGLSGETIPLGARIIAIVDAFEAMTTVRPYSARRTEEQALAELHRCAGTQFDPVLTNLFCHSIQPNLPHVQPTPVI